MLIQCHIIPYRTIVPYRTIRTKGNNDKSENNWQGAMIKLLDENKFEASFCIWYLLL